MKSKAVRMMSVAGSLLAASVTVALSTASAQPALLAGRRRCVERICRIGYAMTDKYWAVYETEGGQDRVPAGLQRRPARAVQEAVR